MITTAVLVYITWQILKVSNKPEVLISHDTIAETGEWPPKFTSYLYVKNVGQSLARKIRFESTDFSKNFYGDKSLEDIKFLMDGIESLAPGDEVSHTCTHEDLRDYQGESLKIMIDIAYEDSRGKTHKPKTFTLEFERWRPRNPRGTNQI